MTRNVLKFTKNANRHDTKTIPAQNSAPLPPRSTAGEKDQNEGREQLRSMDMTTAVSSNIGDTRSISTAACGAWKCRSCREDTWCVKTSAIGEGRNQS